MRDPKNGKPHHQKEHISAPQETIPHPSTHKPPFLHLSIRFSSSRTPPPFPTILYPRIKKPLAGRWQTSEKRCQKKHDREPSIPQATQVMKKRGEIGLTHKPYQSGKVVGKSKILTKKKSAFARIASACHLHHPQPATDCGFEFPHRQRASPPQLTIMQCSTSAYPEPLESPPPKQENPGSRPPDDLDLPCQSLVRAGNSTIHSLPPSSHLG